MDKIINNINGSGIFIQIGAGAGDLDTRANCRDGFTEFIKKLPRNRIKKILLVEPNPINIPLLRQCWKDYPEAIIYEIAIIPKYIKNKYIDFYYCPDDGPHYQVASINKEHVQKHYINSTIEKISVGTTYLETFINNIIKCEEIELLSLDIEGIDAEIILDLDINNINLQFISFEYIHLGDNMNNVIKHLESKFIFLGKGADHNGFDYLYKKLV